MKGVLISIKPKWCEKIANGEKTIEVRKTKPNIEIPFKCYIYCTKNYGVYDLLEFHINGNILKMNNKVVGEFVCDKIEQFECCCVPYKDKNNLGYEKFLDNGVYKNNNYDGIDNGVVFERNDKYLDTMLKNEDLSKMCLSAQELCDYIQIGKSGYAWHISDLKIYDKPKELSEFIYICKYIPNAKCYPDNCNMCAYNRVTRPPQSWCYVEEL